MSQGTSRIGNESPEQVLTYRGPQQEVLSNNFTTPGGRTCTIYTTDKARMRLTASAAGRASPGFSPSRGGVPPFSVMSMLPPQHPAVVRKSNSAMNRGFAKTARTRGCLDTAARWRLEGNTRRRSAFEMPIRGGPLAEDLCACEDLWRL